MTTLPAAPPTSGVSAEAQENERLLRLIETQDGVIRENARAQADMNRRFEELSQRVTTATTPPGPTDAERDTEFWKNPTRVIRDLISTEMKATSAPINERLARTESEQIVDRAKERLKREYGDVWSTLEPQVDQFLANATSQGVAVNDQVLDVAATAAFGAYHKGLLTQRPPAPTPTPTPERPVVTPPHTRPSVAAIPGREAPTREDLRPLTENEERLRRERKQTHEEFLSWLTVPPDQVITSKIGRPAT